MTFWASAKADVYERNPTTREFTILRNSGVACRLTRVATGTATGNARAELAQSRAFLWDPAIVLPERGIQLEVDGERWNPVAGTFGLAAPPATHRRCEIVAVRT